MDRGCRQEEALTGYLYNECEPEEHARLEAHLATCAQELESLRSVCGPLAEWTPPEPSLGFRVVSDRDTGRVPWWRGTLQPAWGLARGGRRASCRGRTRERRGPIRGRRVHVCDGLEWSDRCGGCSGT